MIQKKVTSNSVVKSSSSVLKEDTSSLTDQFKELKLRVDAVKQKRSEKLAMLEMYKQQYNALVQKVKELGIEKVSDLPNVIKAKEAELSQKFEELEKKLQQAEKILNGQ
jgi:flagellar capping protein FliD